jgi:hypothetical protein
MVSSVEACTSSPDPSFTECESLSYALRAGVRYWRKADVAGPSWTGDSILSKRKRNSWTFKISRAQRIHDP